MQARPFAWRYLVAAWLVPGAGHALLGRKGRALLFFTLILACFAVGLLLDGRLYRLTPGQPLASLAGLACMAIGVPYWLASAGLDYAGDWTAPGFEYGKAFILTAGLMNVLVILDAWDIARGEKE